MACRMPKQNTTNDTYILIMTISFDYGGKISAFP